MKRQHFECMLDIYKYCFLKTIVFYVGGAPLAQRCMSDPGANSPTVSNEKGFREQCLGEDTYTHAQKCPRRNI